MPYKDPQSPQALEATRAKRRRYWALHRDEINERKRKKREKNRRWFEEHPEYRNEYASRTYYALRQRMYEMLGNSCEGCGHTDIRILEFDHILDDGAQDRRRFAGTRSMLEYYLRHPEEAKVKLQVLCRNCNWLKRKGYEWRGGRTPKAGGRLLDGRTWDQFPLAQEAFL